MEISCKVGLASDADDLKGPCGAVLACVAGNSIASW